MAPFRHPNNSNKAVCSIFKVLKLILLAIVASLVYISLQISTNDSPKLRPNSPIVNTLAATNTVKITPRNSTTSGSKATIGYAISLTGCGDENLIDGAAVLAHSIKLASYPVGKYDMKLYAIVHPEAVECASELATLGYEILSRDTPVAVKDIEGNFLRENVVNNGCCGEKEFIKLWAYTLVDHPVIIHLDVDTVVLQPLDDIFDVMIDKNDTNIHDNNKSNKLLPVMFDGAIPDRVEAVFTRDYNMAQPDSNKPVGVQGGFLALRPSMEVFEEYKTIIRKGDYRNVGGWGGRGYRFYGAMTFQGIVPYYYDYIVQNQQHVEVSRCVYNVMADNPRDQRSTATEAVGRCRDGTQDCEDCRLNPISTVKLAHFTICQKPWNCLRHADENDIRHMLCRNLHHEWFRIRHSMEQGWQKQHSSSHDSSFKIDNGGDYDEEHFFGYCKSMGHKGYIPVKVPSK